jgi:hypothetical protein
MEKSWQQKGLNVWRIVGSLCVQYAGMFDRIENVIHVSTRSGFVSSFGL